MATGETVSVLAELRRVVLRSETAALGDGALLERFVRRRDEAAFEALVRRHGPMVLGVCRRVLGDVHEAEDAFQATFLVLLSRAASVVPREQVGAWLHGVARRTALKARAVAARRRAKERQAARPCQEQPAADSAHELRGLLDGELQRLPALSRTLVVLCELEGKSRREAAEQLGLAEGTVSSRLARARQRLARRLSARGLVLPAGALALVCTSEASAAVPAPLMSLTIRAVSAGAGGISAPVAGLAEGVLRAMWIKKMVLTMAVVLSLGVLALGGGLLGQRVLADKPAEARQKDAAADGKADKKEQGPSFHGTLKAVDADKGTITVSVPTNPGAKHTEDKTWTVARDVKVVLEENSSKDQPPPEGKLADLSPGTNVTIQLAADKTNVIHISAQGPGLTGTVKAVDAAKNSITVASKGEGGPVEKTLTLTKDAKVLLNDGLTKGTPDHEAKLTDLAEGTSVHVQLSVDRQRALSIRVQGASVHGSVKGVDLGSNVITITLKENAQVVDKMFTLEKDVRVDGGKLADLTEGTPVAVTLSVFDKQKAVVVRILK
jgi:RNA polymerase sigma factor (sigma-70 family)